jgi:hypothetical protein
MLKLLQYTPIPLASSDRPPPRPSKPLPPRGSGVAPAPKPAARPSGTVPPAGDKVAAAYQDLLQEIVEKKKKQAEIRNRPKPKKKSHVLKAVLAVVLPPIVAAIWIFQPFAPDLSTPILPGNDQAAWLMTLDDAAFTILEWRDSAGRLPRDLAEAEIELPNVEYVVDTLGRFTLSTIVADEPVMIWTDGVQLGRGRLPPPPQPVTTDSSAFEVPAL